MQRAFYKGSPRTHPKGSEFMGWLPLSVAGRNLQVGDERRHRLVARRVIGRPEDRRWMYGRYGRDAKRRLQDLATLLADPKRRPHHGLRRRRAEKDEHAGRDHLDLGFEPRPACQHLAGVRFLVEPALAASCPPEMLHGIGHVDPAAIDAGLVETPIEQTACRA